ncbi:M3 family metallopeptidase, partial [Bacillus subtilis]|uniref:M3 family metallopeptidase n=1 Tax=Bacillus subtilis TaxID=1423 RepID=UPI003C172DA5
IQFTVEDCMDTVKTAFSGFSSNLEAFAQTAFENRWVDFEPRAGKRGGAFCSNIYGIKESRFLCNFQGSMNNIITVAHELGHGYHGQQM